jgi:ELWxxDGT repeat protein
LNLAAVGNTLFFQASEPNTGSELWKSDGTAEGTVLVKDIVPGTGISRLSGLTAFGNKLFFVAFIGGRLVLWMSDGTPQGTLPVPGLPAMSSVFPPMVVAGNSLFFQLCGSGTCGLWKTDGTLQGTSALLSQTTSTNIDSLTAVGEMVFFRIGEELWKTDGTAPGTTLVRDFSPSPTPPLLALLGPLIAVDDLLFFRLCEPVTGCELWRSDGTDAGTMLVKDISPGPTAGIAAMFVGGGAPWADVDGILFLSAADGVSGLELWRSEGSEKNTFMLQDIAPGPVSSSPDSFTVAGKNVFFVADDNITGRELWAIPAFARHLPEPAAKNLTKYFGVRGRRAYGQSSAQEMPRFTNQDALESMTHEIIR